MKWLKEHGGLVALALVVSVGLMALRAPEPSQFGPIDVLDNNNVKLWNGNLIVGDGTPTTAQTVGGAGLYVEGAGEFDGALLLDAGLRNTMTEDYITTTAANTITAAECWGKVFTMSSTSDDPVTHNLPAAVAGMTVTFVDLDATAAADLIINPDDADKINLGTAGVSYNSTGDAIGECITLYAIDSTNWVSISRFGTWGAGS